MIQGAAYTFTTIDVPFAGAQDTYALGINDSGQIVGFYTEPGNAICGLACNRGFLDSGGVFTQLTCHSPRWAQRRLWDR